MAVETSGLEAKAHELLGQLGPGKLAAVVQLLEVMIHDDEDESVTDEARRPVVARDPGLVRATRRPWHSHGRGTGRVRAQARRLSVE